MISKRVWTRVFLSLVAVLATCFAAQAAFATTVVVGTCIASLPQFTTIQAAVNSIPPAGGTVEVCPGTYAEQVLITRKLTLTGIQSGTGDAAVIVPPAGGIVANGTDIFNNPVAAQIFVNSPAGAVVIERLTVDGTGNNLPGCVTTTLEGIYYQNTSGTITNNVVRNQYQTDYASFGGCQNGLAINVESPNSGNIVTVSNNSVRAYQKNGITATGAAAGAGSPGPAVTILGNYIVGLGATAMNWQGVYLGEGTAAENGVQVGFGASGKVQNNTVNDNIWGQDTSSDTGDAASGILIFASPGISVTGNEVGSAQFGIVTVSDGSALADNTIITSNKVVGTQIFDGIDACSNGNTIQSNTVYGSTESGIHLDATCGSTGNNNTASKNIVVEGCAGILTGAGTTGNTTSPNTIFDVTNTTLAGDVCPAVMADRIRQTGSASGLQPSPYRPNQKRK